MIACSSVIIAHKEPLSASAITDFLSVVFVSLIVYVATDQYESFIEDAQNKYITLMRAETESHGTVEIALTDQCIACQACLSFYEEVEECRAQTDLDLALHELLSSCPCDGLEIK